MTSKKDRLPTGILYIVLFEIEDRQLVKIGVTGRCIEDRVSEILVAIFKKYREFPYARPKRFRKIDNPYINEKILHKYFEKYNYVFKYKFSGCTEFFDIPLDDAVVMYEKLMNGDDILEKK